MPNSEHCFGGATMDQSFRLKCHMYDQMRLVSMKVSILPLPSTSGDTQALRTYQIATIWDRKANFKEVTTGHNNDDDTDMDEQPSANQIFNNPGVTITNITAGVTNNITRSCYPRDLAEKTAWMDSALSYITTAAYAPTERVTNYQWLTQGSSFSPCLYIALRTNTAYSGQTYIRFNYKVEYNFAFRNPKNTLPVFLKLEAPSYVNPAGAKSNTLSEEAIKQQLASAKKLLEDLGVDKEQAEEAAEEAASTLDVEDDPGTS